jgi:V-type H+-transporting ATPase subunit H
LLTGSVPLSQGQVLALYTDFVRQRLDRAASEPYLLELIAAFQLVLRVDVHRVPIYETGLIKSVVNLYQLKRSSIPLFQLYYQLTLVLWTISFDPVVALRINDDLQIIPQLLDILRGTQKEKVTRIIYATLRNLVEKPEEPYKNAAAMVAFRLQPMLRQAALKQWTDADITEDIQYVTDKLNSTVHEMRCVICVFQCGVLVC